MNIKSHLKEYKILIEKDLSFWDRITGEDNTFFVIDRLVYDKYTEIFSQLNQNSLMLIDALEENKTIDTALQICERMTELPSKRNSLLVSVGGGIIQDITGFAANVLYRGIKWIFVPTTLLAACDSCIGGKTSLNYKKFKNLLGTFYPPDEIYICPRFFKTLSKADFESGLGEVVKFNIMQGSLEGIKEAIPALMDRDDEALRLCVEKSLGYKKTFIEQDEFDRGERIKLNFAHTFGHAIETCTKYAIPHGTAVAIGMIMANSISLKRGLISSKFNEECRKVLLQIIHVDKNLLDFSEDDYMAAIRKDKKQISTSLTAVLLKEKPLELEIIHDMQREEAVGALNEFKELYEV